MKWTDPATSSSHLPLLLSSSSPLLCEIKFPCGSRICCTARWFIRDAKSMQKQSLLHPFPACQPGSCWLFIKGAAQVRRMHPDALIDCLLPRGDSSWMDWTAGGGKEGRGKSADSVAPSARRFHVAGQCCFYQTIQTRTNRTLTLSGLKPVKDLLQLK